MGRSSTNSCVSQRPVILSTAERYCRQYTFNRTLTIRPNVRRHGEHHSSDGVSDKAFYSRYIARATIEPIVTLARTQQLVNSAIQRPTTARLGTTTPRYQVRNSETRNVLYVPHKVSSERFCLRERRVSLPTLDDVIAYTGTMWSRKMWWSLVTHTDIDYRRGAETSPQLFFSSLLAYFILFHFYFYFLFDFLRSSTGEPRSRSIVLQTRKLDNSELSPDKGSL